MGVKIWPLWVGRRDPDLWAQSGRPDNADSAKALSLIDLVDGPRLPFLPSALGLLPDFWPNKCFSSCSLAAGIISFSQLFSAFPLQSPHPRFKWSPGERESREMILEISVATIFCLFFTLHLSLLSIIRSISFGVCFISRLEKFDFV